MKLIEKIRDYFKKKTHRCSMAKFPDSDDEISFHYEIPWMFHQEFKVCEVCNKVKVVSCTSDGSIPGGYGAEKDGEQWSGNFDSVSYEGPR